MQTPGTDIFGYAEYCTNGKSQIFKFCGSVPRDLNSNRTMSLNFLPRPGAMSMLHTVRQSIFTLESCWFLPINMNSVSSSLSLSLSVSIHVRMSDVQRSMTTTAPVWFKDYPTKFYGEACPELQRHSHFKYASFDRKGTPFVYIPLTMVPLWLT